MGSLALRSTVDILLNGERYRYCTHACILMSMLSCNAHCTACTLPWQLHVLYSSARKALVRKRSYLGLSNEKRSVHSVFHSVPFRVLVLPMEMDLQTCGTMACSLQVV